VVLKTQLHLWNCALVSKFCIRLHYKRASPAQSNLPFDITPTITISSSYLFVEGETCPRSNTRPSISSIQARRDCARLHSSAGSPTSHQGQSSSSTIMAWSTMVTVLVRKRTDPSACGPPTIKTLLLTSSISSTSTGPLRPELETLDQDILMTTAGPATIPSLSTSTAATALFSLIHPSRSVFTQIPLSISGAG